MFLVVTSSALLVGLTALGAVSAVPHTFAANAIIFSDRFEGPDGLLASEYSERLPTAPDVVVSSSWLVTNGSFFRDRGTGWTGRPDTVNPDVRSANGTGSAVFRLLVRRIQVVDTRISFRLRVAGIAETGPSLHAWDGVHVMVRYLSQYQLYYATVNRRDNTIVIKKKCPGGQSNGGTYYALTRYERYEVPLGAWQSVRVTTRNVSAGVRIMLEIGEVVKLEATDLGVGCPPIVAAGSVGVRGDNAEFQIDDFKVAAIS